MDDEDFWALIDGSRQRTSDPGERLEWLREQLLLRPTADLVQFQASLVHARQPVDTKELWAAARQILDGFCSDDGFWYFQVWVIGLGREAYLRVVANPDNLADIPEVRALAGRSWETWYDHEFPDWEELEYVAVDAFEELTGEEDGLEEALEAAGLDGPLTPEPTGEAWDVRDRAEAARRLPRLSELFPLSRQPE